jgi:hypothetical protein
LGSRTLGQGSRLARWARSDALLCHIRPARRLRTGQARLLARVCRAVSDKASVRRTLVHRYGDGRPALGAEHAIAGRSRAPIGQLHRPFLRALMGNPPRSNKHLERSEVGVGMASPINSRGRLIAGPPCNLPQVMAGTVASHKEHHCGQSDRDRGHAAKTHCRLPPPTTWRILRRPARRVSFGSELPVAVLSGSGRGERLFGWKPAIGPGVASRLGHVSLAGSASA